MIYKEGSGSKIDLEEIQESANEEPIVNTDTQPEVVTPDKISDSTLNELDEPTNYKEAMANPKAAKWKESIKSHISLFMDEKVHTYKARLAKKGYTQTHEIDYKETFSPVSKIKLIRIMLAITTFHDYEIWQMDVKTAFLNEKLTKDMFMAQLEEVTQFGFSRSEDESCIYVKVSGSVVVFLISNDLCPKTDEELYRMSRVPYASVVVSIMYAMTYTRPDVSFALSMNPLLEYLVYSNLLSRTYYRKKSGRVSNPFQFYYGFHIDEDKISDSTLNELDEPTNYKEAMANPKAAKWKESIKSNI
ncbi:retrotransposon protein, putative, ty1-copia subclass [Tanacetum coccineum]|uniref:Retrotransposon protein, putative, ty1-copia subclass n=1 Tax=Tanacetum coccineum TaxID=301880 RepID=A0ABQ4XZ60_9ASTR